MTYFNNLGQARVGWRIPSGNVTPTTLWNSIYGVWNADTLGTSLDTSIYRVYNGDNVNDTSGNAQNGTNVGGVTFTTGKIGNAFTFNGTSNSSGNYIQLPNDSLNISTDFSISFWVNFTDLSNSTVINTILSNYAQDGTNSWGYTVYTVGNSLGFNIFNGTTNVVTLTDSVVGTTNVWYYYVITRKSGTGTKLYKNGSLQVSNTSSVNPVYNSGNMRPSIGGLNNGPLVGNSVQYFIRNGSKIDALTVWNRELTADEVLSLYNQNTGAEYPFSSQLLPSLNDATPNANNGTRPSSTLSGGVPGPSFITGKIGKAFQFDGINDYVSLPNTSGEFNFTGDFSISTWFRSSNLSASRYFINNYQNNGSYWGYGWSFFYSSSLGFVFHLNNGAVNNQVNYQSSYSPNVWYHVVAVRTMGQKTKIYVNGVDTPATQSGSVSTAAGYIANQKMDLGGYSPLNLYALCDLDAVSFWNRALTQADVTELYNSGNGKQYTN